MNSNYVNIDPRFHPYRDKYFTLKKLKKINPKKVKISTTGQLLLNITDKEFIYYTDKNNSKQIEYLNKLPREYIPKIKVIIKETEKNLKNKKKIFTKKYLNKVYNNFKCKSTQQFINKTKTKRNSLNKTKRNKIL